MAGEWHVLPLAGHIDARAVTGGAIMPKMAK
jgi:hypothetical protein